MISKDSAIELSTALADELQRACTDVFATEITFRRPRQWLVSTVLVLELNSLEIDWDTFTDGFETVSCQSPLIHGLWSDDNQAIWLHMGLDVWQSTRLDRFCGSRVLSMLNNDPIDSTKRMQTIKVVPVTDDFEGGDRHLIDDTDAALQPSISVKPSQLKDLQVMAHHLRASLRLRSSDVSKVIRLLANYGMD